MEHYSITYLPTSHLIIADPTDFLISALCQPDTTFKLDVDNFPECQAWCPSQKPIPPNETGIRLTILFRISKLDSIYQTHYSYPTLDTKY